MSLLARTFLPLGLGAGLALAGGIAQEQETTFGLSDLVDRAREEQGLEAGAITVAIGEDLVFADAFGPARAGKQQPADLATSFPADDLAHAWLSVLVLQLRARGKVQLDAELGGLLGDLVGEECPVHVSNLLNHSSGLADYSHFLDADDGGGASYALLLAPVKAQPLSNEPGECVSVNPTNTLLLAALVERLAGRPAEVELAARLFGPLDLEDSGYRLAMAVPAALQKDVEIQPRAFDVRRLFTSARDLLRFQRGLVDLELLGSADLERMRRATRLTDGRLEPCGMGSQLLLAGESEGATMGGDRAAVTYFPEHDLTVVALLRGDAPRADRLVLRLAESVIEVPEQGIVDLYLTRAEMWPYLGTYNIGCNTLLIQAGEGRIVLDRTDSGSSVLLYQGGHRFVAQEDPGLELVFELEGARAEWFTLIDHGLRSVARRIDG